MRESERERERVLQLLLCLSLNPSTAVSFIDSGFPSLSRFIWEWPAGCRIFCFRSDHGAL